MKCVFITSFVCAFWIKWIMADNFTFTYNMAMRCKEYICRHGYSYDTFFQVNTEDSNPPSSSETVLEMHIAILAASNGHILLSTLPHPEAEDPVYEIVVGGGSNKFTELRRNLRKNARNSAKTVGILSPIELRAFYIKISEDGLIEFGKEGDPLPILSYTDVNPISIRYFSFAAWNGVEAKFLYDCPPPGKNVPAPNSKAVEPKLSNSEWVKRTLLLDKPANLPPGKIVNVKMGIKIISAQFNTLESKLTTGLAIVSSWTDDSMAWNPSKFNNTTRLNFRQGEIWRPTYFVFNSDDMGAIDTKNPGLILMENSGEATFHFQTKLTTWCVDRYEQLNKWPHDEHSCAIIIGPWEPHEEITVELMNRSDPKFKAFSDIDDVVQNEWDIVATMGIVPVDLWNTLFTPIDNQTNHSDRVILKLNLKRRPTSYNVVFYTPLLVLATFVLMSFWSEPLQMSRVWFYAGSVVVISMGLCYIDYLVPCHTVPSVLILYTTVLAGVILALFINIILMTSLANKFCKTAWMQAMLTSHWFRTVFCLPTMKSCRIYESINQGYDVQEDDDSGVIIGPRHSNVEEMQTDANKYGEAVELAEAVDKLLFVIYSLVFAVLLALHF